jgi:hypothetical protein
MQFIPSTTVSKAFACNNFAKGVYLDYGCHELLVFSRELLRSWLA